jgi:DNA-binding response OmpR family regulator
MVYLERVIHMEGRHILVVEDEKRLQDVVRIYMEREGYRVSQAYDGEEALRIIGREKIDLVLLDVMLPRMDGWQVSERIRETSQVPIIMVTARTQEYDKIKGFDLGVDDYVSKPFSPRVLVKRVQAVLRRSAGPQSQENREEPLRTGELTVNPVSRECFVGDTPVTLARKEFDLLLFIMRHPNQVFSREQLLDQVWGDLYVDDRTVDTHIKQLREKIGPCRGMIQTVWGVGYKFVPAADREDS